jgi:hypothetical protein
LSLVNIHRWGSDGVRTRLDELIDCIDDARVIAGAWSGIAGGEVDGKQQSLQRVMVERLAKRQGLDVTDRKSLLALRGVGPESEAENVRFHGRRVTKMGPEVKAVG